MLFINQRKIRFFSGGNYVRSGIFFGNKILCVHFLESKYFSILAVTLYGKEFQVMAYLVPVFENLNTPKMQPVKRLSYFLITAFAVLISCSSFAQIKFTADDGLNNSRPNDLLFSKTGNADGELVYAATPNEAIIKWQTIKEANTSHFEIQISFDGIAFTPVKTVAASDNTQWQTNYQVTFRKTYLSAQKVYYRLKILFSDNSVEYSEPVFFKISTGLNQASYASLH